MTASALRYRNRSTPLRLRYTGELSSSMPVSTRMRGQRSRTSSTKPALWRFASRYPAMAAPIWGDEPTTTVGLGYRTPAASDVAVYDSQLSTRLGPFPSPRSTGTVLMLASSSTTVWVFEATRAARMVVSQSSRRPKSSTCRVPPAPDRPTAKWLRTSTDFTGQPSSPMMWSMQRVRAATSSLSIAGNMAMRSWLRPSLR